MMVFRVAVFALLVACSLAMPAAHPEFAAFKTMFNKTYTISEEINRLRIFETNLLKIDAHNKDPRWTYTLGVNQYADMTAAEFAAMYAQGKMWDSASAVDEMDAHDGDQDMPVSSLPASLDWREKNVVTDPKNQGGCGSCWAFSTAETLESHIAIKTGKLMEFSPQEYVSCAPNPDHCGGTGGCAGSTQILGFQYAIKTGITTDASYPYQGATGTCDTSKIKPVAKITGYVKLPSNNYTALMNAVVSQGPIAISAAAEPWQLYSGGVYNGDCGSDIDHAIQLVGYGTDPKSSRQLLGGGGTGSGDYWLVRNSWGPGWGEKGYIRIQRYGEGKEPCLTDKKPGDGYGCTGGPASVQVCGICGLMSESSYPTGGSLV
eukprot:TRINITY_DN2020_c0_g1_i1.p1 TRINITY_DN2020_c0_g1~~TRINITY_DN2020_c0_g1_i1.p1  ORF type:complete len:375 (-),score=96.95 TRINITY_DN2020_c0_g1_i1:290-1414(-)